MHKINRYLIHDSHSPFHSGSLTSHLTSHTPTKSNLNFDAVTTESALYKLLTFHNHNLMSKFLRLRPLSKEDAEVEALVKQT
jgi:hypothetical protein